MVEGHDFVSAAMNDIDRAVDILHSIDVREFVEGEGPSEVEDNSER